MDRQTSTYLDCARFAAACTVMLAHIDGFMVVRMMPFVEHLGMEAVGVFFVLSGYVIGYTVETRELDLRSYAVNRAARLYSVVIPCLTATLVLDTLGRHLLPGLFYPVRHFGEEAWRVVLSFSFLTYSWLMPHEMQPGTDGAFWTLCCEAAYYAMFGAVWFLRGARRVVAPVAVLALAGPIVLPGLPLWLLGVWLYRQSRHAGVRPKLGWRVLGAGGLLWLGYEWVLRHFNLCPDVNADIRFARLLIYGGGLSFAVSIVGFRLSGIRLDWVARPVRWLAGATFTMYLLHLPLAWFLNGVMMRSALAHWPAPARWALLVSAVFAGVLAMAQVTERRKEGWRRAIGWALAGGIARKARV